MTVNWTLDPWLTYPYLRCIKADLVKQEMSELEQLKLAMDSHSSTACTLGWIMMAFSVLGIISNFISIRIFTQGYMRCVPVNALLAGLSCIDLFLSTFILPVFVLPALTVYYKWKVMDHIQPYITFVLYPLTLTTQTCSVWVFLLITCERWAAVCRPLQARRYSSVSNAKRAFIAVCTAAVLYNLVRYGEFRLVTYKKRPNVIVDDPVFVYDCEYKPGQKSERSTPSGHFDSGRPLTIGRKGHPETTINPNHSVVIPGTDFGMRVTNLKQFLPHGPCCGPGSRWDDVSALGQILNLNGSATGIGTSAPSGTSSEDPAGGEKMMGGDDGDSDGNGGAEGSGGGVELAPRLRDDPAYMFFYYFGLYLLTHFVLPFSILLIVNIHVVRTILETRAQRRLLTRHERREHRIALMMGVVIVAFLMCNTIPFIMNLLEAYDRSYFHRPDTLYTAHLVNDIGNLLVVVHSSTTSFIYYAFSERYRRRYAAMFCGSKKNKQTSIRSHRSNLSCRYSVHGEMVAVKEMANFYTLTVPNSPFSTPRREYSNGQPETQVFLPGDRNVLSV